MTNVLAQLDVDVASTLEDELARRVRHTAGPRRPRTATVTYRDPEDRMVTVNLSAVDNAILLALGERPRMKWQLREALHLPESVIYRQLLALRARGVVKVFGKSKPQWALTDWQPSLTTPVAVPTDAVNEYMVVRQPTPAPATDSWWTRPEFQTRAQFQARARRGRP